MAERPLPAPSNTTVWVPETLLERTARAVELKQPVIAAFQAKDADELRRCLLKESQFLISCTLHDFERPSPSTPLPPQFLLPGARSKLVRGLQADLARVNQQLQQEEQRQPGPAPASPAAEGRES